MDGSKYRQKGYGMAGGTGKRLPYVLLLLVFLTAAALTVVVMHKVREQRVFAMLLQEGDRQVVSLRVLLQKEKAYNKETKRKVAEMKATISSLRTQKTDLKTKLKGLEATATNLKTTLKELEASLKEKDSRISQMEERASNLHNTQKELEASLKERDNHIKQIEEKATNLQKTQKEQEVSLKERDRRINLLEEKAAVESNNDKMSAVMEILQMKEAELEEIKTRYQDRRVASSKRTPEQTNNTNARHAVVVAGNFTNSSNHTTTPATLEEKSAGNTTVTESKHQKQKARSLEEKQLKLTGDIEADDLQDIASDDFLDMDDIYGDSHSRKSEFPRRNNNDLMNSHVDNQKSRHSLNQDNDRSRSSKLLKKENSKADETKKKNGTAGHLEDKISKDSLSDATLNRPKQGSQEMADAADVKPKVPVNDDATQQKNKRQKNKKSKPKKTKMIDTLINGDGEVTQER